MQSPAGDPAIIGALFALHAEELRHYARRIVRSQDAAEDVVQDVFLRLWLARDRVQFGAAMRSYLYVSTRARAIDALARVRRDERRDPLLADDLVADEAVPCVDEADAACEVDPTAVVEAVTRVLATLPPRQRRVATLRLHDQLDTRDSARMLGISPRTVEAHLARARCVLRAEVPKLLAANR